VIIPLHITFKTSFLDRQEHLNVSSVTYDYWQLQKSSLRLGLDSVAHVHLSAAACHHLDWFTTASTTSFHVILTISKPFWNNLHHVTFGRPLVRLPPAGVYVHVTATLVGQWSGKSAKKQGGPIWSMPGPQWANDTDNNWNHESDVIPELLEPLTGVQRTRKRWQCIGIQRIPQHFHHLVSKSIFRQLQTLHAIRTHCEAQMWRKMQTNCSNFCMQPFTATAYLLITYLLITYITYYFSFWFLLSILPKCRALRFTDGVISWVPRWLKWYFRTEKA